jgi:hypothetical protein
MRVPLVLVALAVAACAPMSEGDSRSRDDVPELGDDLRATCTSTTTAELGAPICRTKVGDVELKLAVPDGDVDGLAVFLHGDTANGWLDDFGYEYLIDAVTNARLALVAALAPNGCSWWRTKDECDFEVEDESGANADALAAALARVEAGLGAAHAPVRYVGYSGGSTFLTGHFLPLHGDEWPGVMVANCGGEIPIYDFAWDVDDAALRAQLPVRFTLGSEDFMAEYVDPADTTLRSLGFDVDKTVLAGFDHCDAGVDWDGLTLTAWGL